MREAGACDVPLERPGTAAGPPPAPGRAARRPCGSGSRWCPWPPCGSPACCGSTCPGSGSTSSTPSPSRGPSQTTPSSAPTEVRTPPRGGARAGGRAPTSASCAFLRRHPAQQVPLHRRPGGDPAAERVGASVQQVRARAALPEPAARSWAGSESGRDPRAPHAGSQAVPHSAADHSEQARAPLAAGSALTKVPPVGRHLAQQKRAYGSFPQAAGRGAQPRWPGARAAGALLGSSSSRPRACGFLRTHSGPGHSAARQAGCATASSGRQMWRDRLPRPLVGLALPRPLAGQAQTLPCG